MARVKGSIQQRGARSWRIRYIDNDGLRQAETIKGAREDAERELLSRLSDLSKGIPVSSRPNTVLFGSLCKDVMLDYEVNGFRSYDDIETRFRLHIEPAFGKRKASQITTAQLNAYIVQRRNDGAKTGTINRELEAIRHTFKLAIRGRKLHHMPHVPHLREDNVRAGFFTEEEIERLCVHLKKPLDSFVRFAMMCGWRREEIRDLRWANVDFARSEVRLDAGKTKNLEARVFPMTNAMRTLLQELKPQHVLPGAHVFSTNGRPIGEFRKSWRTANHKAGLPCIYDAKGKLIRAVRLFHDIRRSCVKSLVAQGIPERVIMAMCGWKTRSVLDRYHIIGAADMAIARERMDAHDTAFNR